jgi:hypothetical protein
VIKVTDHYVKLYDGAGHSMMQFDLTELFRWAESNRDGPPPDPTVIKGYFETQDSRAQSALIHDQSSGEVTSVSILSVVTQYKTTKRTGRIQQRWFASAFSPQQQQAGEHPVRLNLSRVLSDMWSQWDYRIVLGLGQTGHRGVWMEGCWQTRAVLGFSCHHPTRDIKDGATDYVLRGNHSVRRLVMPHQLNLDTVEQLVFDDASGLLYVGTDLGEVWLIWFA